MDVFDISLGWMWRVEGGDDVAFIDLGNAGKLAPRPPRRAHMRQERSDDATVAALCNLIQRHRDQ